MDTMDAKTNEATLSEKQAHTELELMKAHTELMKAQARVAIAQAIALERKNKQSYQEIPLDRQPNI